MVKKQQRRGKYGEQQKKGEDMDFTYMELALLNRMIVIALMSGEIEFNEVSESVHKKIADEIVKRNSPMEETEQITSE